MKSKLLIIADMLKTLDLEKNDTDTIKMVLEFIANEIEIISDKL